MTNPPMNFRSRALLGLIPAILCASVPPARATTYYVSQSSGNDSWTGIAETPANGNGPWKSLAKASSANLAPGDRLLLKCGDTWNEELQPKGNGTPAKPIIISSYGQGSKPAIDRQDDKQDRNGIRLTDQAGFKISGLEFARCMTGIYADYSASRPTVKFLRIEDCYFHDSLLYQHYEDYPKHKIGLGICLFSNERANKIVLADVSVKNCVFRKLASGFWTNSPDNFNKGAGNIYNFANITFDDCLFEEGYQWQLGMRGVDGGAVRNCVTHDIGRGFRAFNGVAGAMFARCKNWVFDNSEWGFIDIGQGSRDGEAFDFESNCDHMTMRNCLFHDTDGPGFLLCCYASGPEPEKDILMENCVLNGKATRPIGLPRCEIVNTTDWNEVTWKNCRFYLSPGEALMKVMDPEKDKKSKFVGCLVRNLGEACATKSLTDKARVMASSAVAGNEAAMAIDGKEATCWKATTAADQWLQIVFPAPRAINEFQIKEDATSSVARYVIQCRDPENKKWVDCFNGRTIGRNFVAPVVGRTTLGVRLMILRTSTGSPAISEFGVFNDSGGTLFNDPTGAAAVGVTGK